MSQDRGSPDGLRALSTDSPESLADGARSPGASEDWGCGSELAQADRGFSLDDADLHANSQLTGLSDDEAVGGRGSSNLFDALRSRGGRPASSSSSFTALQYPLLQLGGDVDQQTRTEATLNLLNNLLGVAIMAMPRAFANVGVLPGLFLMLLMAVANRYTLLVVLRMSTTALEDQEPSYPEIGKRVFGRQGLLAVLFCYLLLTGGCLIGMVIGLADTLDQLTHTEAPRFVWVLAAVVLCMPGSLLRTLRGVALLSGVCMVGVVTIVVTLSAVCVGDVLWPSQRAFDGVSSIYNETLATLPPTVADNTAHWMSMDARGVFATTSIFALQFSIQAGGIEVLTRMAPDEEGSASDGYDNGLPSAERVTNMAYAIAALLCGTVGIAGYMRFGSQVKGNVLLSFTVEEHLMEMTLIRIAYVFVITCSFAFIIVPCRFAAYDLFGLRRRNVAGDSPEGISKAVFRRTTCCILLVCLLFALFVTDLAQMFNYVGTWATMAIAFILPCAFQLELRRRQEGTSYKSPANGPLLLLVLLGLIIMLGNGCEWISEFFGQVGGGVNIDAGMSD